MASLGTQKEARVVEEVTAGWKVYDSTTRVWSEQAGVRVVRYAAAVQEELLAEKRVAEEELLAAEARLRAAEARLMAEEAKRKEDEARRKEEEESRKEKEASAMSAIRKEEEAGEVAAKRKEEEARAEGEGGGGEEEGGGAASGTSSEARQHQHRGDKGSRPLRASRLQNTPAQRKPRTALGL